MWKDCSASRYFSWTWGFDPYWTVMLMKWIARDPRNGSAWNSLAGNWGRGKTVDYRVGDPSTRERVKVILQGMEILKVVVND